jgi:hypothetical protein
MQGKSNVTARKADIKGKAAPGNTMPLPEIKLDPSVIRDALFFSPSFVNVSPGDHFITTLIYYNKSFSTLSDVDVWIHYNPSLVKPAWIDTQKLQPYVKDGIDARFWADRGYIHVGAKFGTAPKGIAVELADIHWRAVSAGLGSRIELAGPAGCEVAVRDGEKNLIGGKTIEDAQKVSVSVNVTPLDWDEPGLRTVEHVDNMMAPPPLDKASRLRLAILAPQGEVATGQVATANVALINPKGLRFDDLQMRIRFDPADVEILDADEDNFISDGLNIFDGDFLDKFPFDGHLANLVEPERGVIDYHVASVMGPKVFPTGIFARIVYRMKRDSGKAAFWFEVEDPDLRVRSTDVTAYGRSLLGSSPLVAQQALQTA